MGLMVDQYHENGTKILDDLSKKRDAEKSNKRRYLEHKKKQMVRVYSDAKNLVVETTTELKENSITGFEEAWRKQQREVQRSIAGGRAGV